MADTPNPNSRSEAETASLSSSGAPDRVHPSIGPYRLLDRIGEGGMGEVWLAEQSEPIRRRVALKLIKPGMDTREVVARFEAERQALALMEHPNVAHVIDAGSAPDGRPYFVMEYVRGSPINIHCDTRRLSTRDRLRLFVQVCEGVQHAHHKGIIHRDLKPSNVLVEIVDDRAMPKVIDFGVAKATNLRLTQKTLFTELGVIVGTPEYMSPEQSDTSIQDVDTRTDVYSLGVMLYELLVGALPLEGKELRAAGYSEFCRRLREVDPPRPSTRITTMGPQSGESARKRSTSVRALCRELRGDLDWLTMKALEKDRTRRYSSVSELAADIQRYLRDEPVLAGPPSMGHRIAKFGRRHRRMLAPAAIAGVLLMAALWAVFERNQASLRAAALQERIAQSQALEAYAHLGEDWRGVAQRDSTPTRLDAVLAPLYTRLLRGIATRSELQELVTTAVQVRLSGRGLQEASRVSAGFEAYLRIPVHVPGASFLVTPKLRSGARKLSCSPVQLGLGGSGTGGGTNGIDKLPRQPGSHVITGYVEVRLVRMGSSHSFGTPRAVSEIETIGEPINLPLPSLSYTVVEAFPAGYPTVLRDPRLAATLANFVELEPVRVASDSTGTITRVGARFWVEHLSGPLALQVDVRADGARDWLPAFGLILHAGGPVYPVALAAPVLGEGLAPVMYMAALPGDALGQASRAHVRVRSSRSLALESSDLESYFDINLERTVPIIREP